MALDLVKSFTFSLLLCSGMFALQIDISPPIETTTGNKSIELSCSLTKDNEYIYSVSIEAYNTTTAIYKAIVTFYPSSQQRPHIFTKYGKHLEGRVSLIANTINDSRIVFHEVQCEDDNKYICSVAFDKDGVPDNKQSSETTITVHSDSMQPDSLTSDSNLKETNSGQNITLTCKGNVGNPPGKFMWKKYLHNTEVPTEIFNISTSTTNVPDNCSYYGTSHLTVQLTEQDNLAVFACVEEAHSSNADMEIQSQGLNVYYAVKDVKITKNPFKQDYKQGAQVNLSCTADGNPIPHNFLWYKEEDIFRNFTTENTLAISNILLNDSGNYTCMAFNSLFGKIYNSTAKTELTVLVTKRVTITSIDTPSDASGLTIAEIFIVVVVVVASVSCALAIIYCCRKRRGKDKRVYKVGNEILQSDNEGQDPNTNLKPDHGINEGYSATPYDENQPLVSPSRSKPKSDNYTEIDLPDQKNEQVMEMRDISSAENKLEDTNSLPDENNVVEPNDEYATVQKRPTKQDQDNRLIDNSEFSDHEPNDEYATVQKRPFNQDQENRLIDNSKSFDQGTSENPGITQKSDSVDRNSLKGLDEQIKQFDQTKGYDNQGFEQDEELLISEQNQTKQGGDATGKYILKDTPV